MGDCGCAQEAKEFSSAHLKVQSRLRSRGKIIRKAIIEGESNELGEQPRPQDRLLDLEGTLEFGKGAERAPAAL